MSPLLDFLVLRKNRVMCSQRRAQVEQWKRTLHFPETLFTITFSVIGKRSNTAHTGLGTMLRSSGSIPYTSTNCQLGCRPNCLRNWKKRKKQGKNFYNREITNVYILCIWYTKGNGRYEYYWCSIRIM